MSDPKLDALRAALSEPRDPDTASVDPRLKPRLRAAAREAYDTKQEPRCSDCGHGISSHEFVTDEFGDLIECRAPECLCRISPPAA